MFKKTILLLATGGGVGWIPGAPGTYGTAVAVILYALLGSLQTLHYLVVVLTLILFSVGVAHLAEGYFQKKDCQKIVIDEIAGYAVTMLFIPWGWKYWVAGFVAFRFFDILKPYPVRFLERHLKGGWGVVGDDVAAGIYANLVLQVLIYWMK